jgi:hypothetical protein
MTTQKAHVPTYVPPARPNLETQAALLPDGKAEKSRNRDIVKRLIAIKQKCQYTINAIETAITLVERGVTLPDVAEAIGLPPGVPRVSRPLKPWRIRPDSNMDVIATMLEDAGRRGVSEVEMLSRLRDLDRLGGAAKPLASVHYTVSELAKRTKFVERRSRAEGARWYAYGRFDVWRNAYT